MKATGIVRRIDDLGRVVVPKEIRRTLRIREGDPLEIYTDQEGEIILKKFSLMGDMGKQAQQYADALAQATGYMAAISDRNHFIAASVGLKKDLLNQEVSKEIEKKIDQREFLVAVCGEENYIPIAEETEEYAWEVVSPIISAGDAVGAVVLLGKSTKDKPGDTERKLAVTAAGFLGRQLEG